MKKTLFLLLLPFFAKAQTGGGVSPIIFYKGSTVSTPAANTTDQIMRSGGIGIGLPSGSAVAAKLDVKGTVKFVYYNNAEFATDSVVIVRATGFLAKQSKLDIKPKVISTLQAVPTPTGNTANLNSIFLATDGLVYFVDASGKSIATSAAPPIEVIRSATPLIGVVPTGATYGYDYNTAIFYYKNNAGNWAAIASGANTAFTSVVNTLSLTDGAGTLTTPIINTNTLVYTPLSGDLISTVNGVASTATNIPTHVPFALTIGNIPFAYDLATQTANVPQSPIITNLNNGTFDFTKGDGTALQNIDLRECTILDNANGTATVTDDYGTVVNVRTNQTLTTLVRNGNELEYTDEVGTLNTLVSPVNNWSLGGNSGLIDGVDNMLGTLDAIPLVFWQNGVEVGRIDDNRTSLGSGSTATGNKSTATGDIATATGNNATATGSGSTATGANATATGANATATGGNATATGANATATGVRSTATGISSTAAGDNATSYSFDEIQLQQGTIYSPISTTDAQPLDRKFNIGNYDYNTNTPHDIFTILKNGQTAIGGFDNFENTTNPAQLQVNGSIASNTIINAAYLGSNVNGEIIAVTAPTATAYINKYDEFTATTAQTTFTLTATPSTGSTLVMFRNGISQSKTTYSYTGTSVTYTGGALALNDRINFQYIK